MNQKLLLLIIVLRVPIVLVLLLGLIVLFLPLADLSVSYGFGLFFEFLKEFFLFLLDLDLDRCVGVLGFLFLLLDFILTKILFLKFLLLFDSFLKKLLFELFQILLRLFFLLVHFFVEVFLYELLFLFLMLFELVETVFLFILLLFFYFFDFKVSSLINILMKFRDILDKLLVILRIQEFSLYWFASGVYLLFPTVNDLVSWIAFGFFQFFLLFLLGVFFLFVLFEVGLEAYGFLFDHEVLVIQFILDFILTEFDKFTCDLICIKIWSIINNAYLFVLIIELGIHPMLIEHHGQWTVFDL